MSDQMVLQCQALAKCYREGPEELQILSDVALAVQARERVAIVGSSGSGKTTLLNLLGGLDHPSSGSVSVLGTDLAGLDEKALGQLRNERIGFVYQFHHLLAEFSALENVAMPLLMRARMSLKSVRERAQVLLERVGLAHRLAHKPGELSGGERQRVAIARALVTQPALVLLDEPTGNLDPHTAEGIHQLMQELSEEANTAFVIVTHDLALAHRMDRVLQLKDGRLVPVDAVA